MKQITEYEREGLAKWKKKFADMPPQQKKMFAEKTTHLHLVCTYPIDPKTGGYGEPHCDWLECEGVHHEGSERCWPL